MLLFPEGTTSSRFLNKLYDGVDGVLSVVEGKEYPGTAHWLSIEGHWGSDTVQRHAFMSFSTLSHFLLLEYGISDGNKKEKLSFRLFKI